MRSTFEQLSTRKTSNLNKVFHSLNARRIPLGYPNTIFLKLNFIFKLWIRRILNMSEHRSAHTWTSISFLWVIFFFFLHLSFHDDSIEYVRPICFTYEKKVSFTTRRILYFISILYSLSTLNNSENVCLKVCRIQTKISLETFLSFILNCVSKKHISNVNNLLSV